MALISGGRSLQPTALGHCFATTAEAKQSASALFTDIRSAYYSIIRPYVTGFHSNDDAFRAIADRLNLASDVIAAVLACIHDFGALLQVGGADPSLICLLQDIHESTWFVVDGSDQIVQTRRGARPSESVADIIFIFVFAKVTKEVRSLISQTPFRVPLPLATDGTLSAQLGVDARTGEVEAVYADDARHGFLHIDPFFVVGAMRVSAQALVSCARTHGLELNFGPGKTEAVLSLRGPGAKALRLDIEA